MELNGGSVVAMIGKDCVAIASDLRLGNQQVGIAANFDKVFPINDKLYCGLPGLATDVYTLWALSNNQWSYKYLIWNRREHLRFRVNMYRMKEEREITPKTFTHLLSSTLYEKRWVYSYWHSAHRRRWYDDHKVWAFLPGACCRWSHHSHPSWTSP